MYIKRKRRVELPASKVPKFQNALKDAQSEMAKFQDLWNKPRDEGGIDTYVGRADVLALREVDSAVRSGSLIKSFRRPLGYTYEDMNERTKYTAAYENYTWDGDGFKMTGITGEAKGHQTGRISAKTAVDAYGPVFRDSEGRKISDPSPSDFIATPGWGQNNAKGDGAVEYMGDLQGQLSTLRAYNLMASNISKANENLKTGKATRSKEIAIFNRNLSIAAQKKNRIESKAQRRRTGTKGHQINLLGSVQRLGGISLG